MTNAGTLVACARRYIGVRFAHQGRSAQGLDCLGLLMLAARDAGVMVRGGMPMDFDACDYGARPDAGLLEKRLRDRLQAVDVPQPGDVLLLRVDGRAQHLALVSDYPSAQALGMIHAYAVVRKVVEHRYDADWQQHTAGVFRLP